MLKLLVVEDHALVREGLARLLAQLEDDVSVAERADFESALNLLDNEQDFDLVLLDLALPGIDGFAGLDILRKRYPAIPVAVVSAFDDVPTVTRVMNHGASGFIPKAYTGEALLNAVREVLAGNLVRPDGPTQAAKLDDEQPLPPPKKGGVKPAEIGLTDRQAQVLALMVRGHSNRDIAQQLDLSEGTVKIHATAVFKALGVTSRTQALVAVARYAVDLDAVF
ncbi:MAG TPA: response regulator transcription factor [Rhodocyclaceae bacterium]|jgi:DNA-binding NarL/FixJ family response regulator|nr:response regulator transcription factor [Betaproteobacteria bacterium]HMV00557.1 response regulator transcription factor [Rhodocyclaceae bacterium]HMV20170.1 response regulator transcription factor [Rhodocyclaceae bacterium]HMW76145.1 response regulator transcription factor [Rhodocyclaceae bacterium]HNE43388.1 response regulator transcription factor [Rhodocyclaceae bacterium]